MKNITYILLLFSLSVFGQRPNRFNDSTYFARPVRFEVPPYLIQGAGSGKVITSDANGRMTWQTFSNSGVSQGALNDSINAVRSIRKVDTLYRNLDSLVFKINGIRYAVKDSFNLNTDSQTLSISNDTLTISGGNSVILPVYIQIDSATITSYDVLNSQNAPPGSPATGDTYLVGTSPSGAWVGHAKDIAEWNGSAWVFTDGVQGDFLYNATNALTYIFRSGNWVQTTGIPALHNGNNISSGLKIGTNNARSLMFETNNINRGRFDSVGRFYVYDTSLRKANKYLQIDSITGRLVASEISGGGGGSSDLATLIDACPNVDVETLDGSETFPILKDDTVYQLSLGAFAELVGGGGIPDAPNDGQLYGRQSENWSLVPDAELPSTDSLEFFTDTSTLSPGYFQEYLGSKVKGRDIGTSGFTTYHQIIYGNGFSYSKMGNASSFILIDDNNDVNIVAQFGKLKIYPPNWDSQPYGSVLTLIGPNGECEWQSVLRGTARVDSTTSSATPTINTDNIDTYKLTAQAVDITSFTTNLSGTPTDDQILHIVIIGTATRAITWGSKFEASTVALPTTTVGTDRLDVYFIWNTNTSKWRCGGVW